MQGLSNIDQDINAVFVTKEEKKFNDLRNRFYDTLQQAENNKEKVVKDNRVTYTNFFKNLNRKQFLKPEPKERQEDKKNLYDMILEDIVEDDALVKDEKRALVRKMRAQFQRIEDDLAKIYEKAKRDPEYITEKDKILDLMVPKDLIAYKKMRGFVKFSEDSEVESQISDFVDLAIHKRITKLEHEQELGRTSEADRASKDLAEFCDIKLKDFENHKLKLHIKNLKKRDYTFDEIDNFPQTIDEIVQMKEFNNPLEHMKDSSEICEMLRTVGLMEHSILKQSYLHMDQASDVSFYKDLSSYSRKVFKDPR